MRKMWSLFFQAEVGIRSLTVTGVQTCALPISPARPVRPCPRSAARGWLGSPLSARHAGDAAQHLPAGQLPRLSEDRKSTRLNSQSQSNLVCRLLLEKKKHLRRKHELPPPTPRL